MYLLNTKNNKPYLITRYGLFSKRLFSIDVIDGKLDKYEIVSLDQKEIGKLLINNKYPFALIKYLNENFDEKANFKTKKASINIKKPDSIKN